MPDVFDVICVGSAKMDAFLSIPHASLHVKLNKDNELCIKSGEKIELDNISFLLGGNASNVSVGLSRLQYNSAIFAEVGDDDFSQIVIKSLNKEKVSTKFLKVEKNNRTSLSIIINFKAERTIFSEHIERKHDFSFDKLSAKLVYLTSLGNKWEEAYNKTFDFIKNNNIKLVFNPGTLQLEKGYEAIKNVLEYSEIFFVNKQEAQSLTSVTDDMKKLLEDIKKLGPKIVVITDGENGSYLLDGDGNYFNQPIIKVNVVEKTGAGDAFASGFLGAFILGHDLQTAMLWGAKNSSSVIQKIGAQSGLLSKSEIENYD